MPLTLLACGGKILLYECVADPEQLQVGAKVNSAMQAFETAAGGAEEHASQAMDSLVAAARQHVRHRGQAEQEAGGNRCPWTAYNYFLVVSSFRSLRPFCVLVDVALPCG